MLAVDVNDSTEYFLTIFIFFQAFSEKGCFPYTAVNKHIILDSYFLFFPLLSGIK